MAENYVRLSIDKAQKNVFLNVSPNQFQNINKKKNKRNRAVDKCFQLKTRNVNKTKHSFGFDIIAMTINEIDYFVFPNREQ